MNSATAAVAEVVNRIEPLDEVEQRHIETTRAWLASTDDIFRRVKPATPPRHLVSYVVLVDPQARAVLLGKHRLAGLWLPTGGHVDPGEHPLETARREAAEEIGIEARFDLVGPVPLFLTVTTTVGSGTAHEDVSLWYVIRGDRTSGHTLDPREFDGERWWDVGEFALPDADPHFGRFLTKLDTALRLTAE
ncbi:NUDIX domain-containing protein [Nocardia gipuzkoensis]|uniref:NUDIX hydrolase n=1 Tax=Nocardia gipuzkoensis TaxID=2749991 RepID=UPI001E54B06D|nr:NUDIX domain-containing protein [Nocardia gipuzkoensis]UGT69228.1 NUDIX domain-containing protein [Nocardia gipuzkoensis]